MKNLTVFLASNDSSNPRIIDLIHELAQLIAKEKVTLVYGGTSEGLMGRLANATLAANGQVIGVFAEPIRTKETPHPRLTQLIQVQTITERITIMQQLADSFMVLPGGLGTLEELFTVWNQIRLGSFKKPFGILNFDQFYSQLQQFLIGPMQKENFITDAWLKIPLISDNVTELFAMLKQQQQINSNTQTNLQI